MVRLCDDVNVGDVDLGDEDDVRLLSLLTPFVEPGGVFGHKGSVSDMLREQYCGKMRSTYVCNNMFTQNCVSLRWKRGMGN